MTPCPGRGAAFSRCEASRTCRSAEAVAAPRLHHQWLPDEVRAERGFADDTLAALRAMGHVIVVPLGQTSANTIAVTPNGLLGAPDPRTRGAEAAGQ